MYRTMVFYMAVMDSSGGVVSMFYWDGGNWRESATITVDGANAFGYAMSSLKLARRTHDVVAFGFERTNQVHVYHLEDDTSWMERGMFSLESVRDASVALSEDGLVFATGDSIAGDTSQSLGDPVGIIQVYVFDDETKQYIARGQRLEGATPNERFGRSVALSADGTVVAGGASFCDTTVANNENAGCVRAYRWDPLDNNWMEWGDVLFGNSTINQIEFGRNVALNHDGTSMAIAAPFADDDYVFVYGYQETTNTWELRGEPIRSEQYSFLGSSIDLTYDGNYLAAGANGGVFDVHKKQKKCSHPTATTSSTRRIQLCTSL